MREVELKSVVADPAAACARLERAGWLYSISVRMQAWVPDAIAQIPEADWQPLPDYPDGGEAQIAVCDENNGIHQNTGY